MLLSLGTAFIDLGRPSLPAFFFRFSALLLVQQCETALPLNSLSRVSGSVSLNLRVERSFFRRLGSVFLPCIAFFTGDLCVSSVRLGESVR